MCFSLVCCIGVNDWIALKELNLATEVPVDTQGHAQFPMIANMDDASRSQLKRVYEDFMRAIWCKSSFLFY